MQIATVTGEIYQNEAKKNTEDFVAGRDQAYFRFNCGEQDLLVGIKDMLMCLSVSEKLGDVPHIGASWWNCVKDRYGDDIEDYSIGQGKE